MAKTDFKSVDEYIASQPEAAQGILESVRAVIRKALPRAEEVISYQIPAFKVDSGAVIYFAGWKEHFSLYPIPAKAQAAFKGRTCTLQNEQRHGPLSAIRAGSSGVDREDCEIPRAGSR